MVASEETEPPGPVAVMVYMVVSESVTGMDPLAPSSRPNGSIRHDSTFVDVHLKTDEPPDSTVS